MRLLTSITLHEKKSIFGAIFVGFSWLLFFVPNVYPYAFDDESLTERYEIIGAISGSYNEAGPPSGVAIIRDKTLNHTITLKMRQKLPGFPGFRLVLIDRGRLTFKNESHQLITLRKAGFQGERVTGYSNYAEYKNLQRVNSNDSSEIGMVNEGFIVDDPDNTSDSGVPKAFENGLPANEVSDQTPAPLENRFDGIPSSMRMGFGQNNEFLRKLPKNLDAIKGSAQRFRKFSIPSNNLPPSIRDGIKNPEVGTTFYDKNLRRLEKASKG